MWGWVFTVLIGAVVLYVLRKKVLLEFVFVFVVLIPIV